MTTQKQLLERAREAVAAVADPEIPSVSIVDLGIVRSIDDRDGEVIVTITPTYSGCPAMQMIENEIGKALIRAGIGRYRIEKVFAPAWTTEWMSETGKRRLKEAGIAPPGVLAKNIPVALEFVSQQIQCPLCGSNETSVTSEFGSTSCKAFYRCMQCLSTFEYFKPI